MGCSGTRPVPRCWSCRVNARWRLGLAFRTSWSGLRQSAFRSYGCRGRPDSVCRCRAQPRLVVALRGAGANFGVTTSLECRLHPVGPVTSGEIYYPVREARPVLRFFRSLMAEAPDSFQATLNLTPGERGVFVSLCHAGDSAEAERLLRAFRTAATLAKDTVRRQEFAELAGGVPTGTPDASFRCVATVYWNELSDEVMDMALDRLSEAPVATVLGISHLHARRGLPDNIRLNGVSASPIRRDSHSY